ncbi:MAG: hypothetical protein IT379_22635 [Deltaproteobacteria bacterium]|nr:hypothetical protein [Deltaproteobacteria bacterium]
MPADKLARILGAYAAVVAVACTLVVWRHAHAPAPPPSTEARRWALGALEAALEGRPVSQAPASARSYVAEGPIFVFVWQDGTVRHRHVGVPNLERAVRDAIRAQRQDNIGCPTAAAPAPDRETRGCRVTLEVTSSRAPALVWFSELARFSFVPSVDGVALTLGGRTAYLTVDEMLSRRLYGGGRTFLVPEMSFGIAPERVLGLLARELDGASTDYENGDVERLRFHRIARIDGSARPRPNAATLRRAAIDGAEFLLRHQAPNGRFTYVYDPIRDEAPAGAGYNWPRHAGTTYFLAQVGRLFGHSRAREGAAKAIRHARRQVRRCQAADLPPIDPEPRCVVVDGNADLGSTALLTIAVAEQAAAGATPETTALLDGLTSFIRQQQRADGEFMHYFVPATGRRIDQQGLYYSGEAMLALLMAHEVTRNRRDLESARRAMRHLSGAAWDFIGSRYYYGEEHWTCIAAGAAYPRVQSEQAYDFCKRWAAWTRNVQFQRGETPFDAEGAYGVGPLLAPRLTPVASRTEAFISTYELTRRHGHDDPELRNQIELALGCLLRHWHRPGLAHLWARPDRAFGGLPGSQVDLDVRNDFVQHAGSALARWADILQNGVRGDRHSP